MEYKLYTYLLEYLRLYPEKAKTVTQKELQSFIAGLSKRCLAPYKS